MRKNERILILDMKKQNSNKNDCKIKKNFLLVNFSN